AARQGRHTRLATLVNQVVAAATKDAHSDFDLDAWKKSRPRGGTQSFQAIADEGGKSWSELLKGLTTTLAVLADQSEDVADDFGLPATQSLAEMRKTHEDRAADRKREAEEAAQAEAAKRVEALVRAAEAALGEDSAPWLDSPAATLTGL